MKLKQTRRAFAASAAVFPFALRSFAKPTSSPRWVFLGTDKGPGISRCSWDPATGKLGTPELAVKAERPDFFALHPTLPRLYSVNSSNGPKAAVSSFHLNPVAGTLTFSESQTSLGDGPCFVSVDHTGRSVFAANYPGGSFVAYDLNTDGSLKPPTGSLDCRNSPTCGTQGPVLPNQNGSHMHSATIAPNNDFVIACDLGNDSIHVFPIHPGAPNPLGTSLRIPTRPGSGPRHVAFHPNHHWLYVTFELDCTVQLFDWSVSNKTASLVPREDSIISTTAPEPKASGDSGCEIIASPNGRFLYTCTRGKKTLEVFSIDQKTGKLTLKQRLACGGSVPRHMAFDPTNRWLLVANQGGPGVTVFAHEPATGKLTGPVQTLPADTPMFIQFI